MNFVRFDMRGEGGNKASFWVLPRQDGTAALTCQGVIDGKVVNDTKTASYNDCLSSAMIWSLKLFNVGWEYVTVTP